MLKVLIVDDEKFNLIIGRDLIKKSKHECEVYLCDDPLEVVNTIEKENIDIVFLDIIMPKKSGIEVLKDIRSNDKFKYVKVIMLTSMADKTLFEESFEIGADDYILKPIDPTEFYARLKATISERKNILMIKEMLEKLKEQNEDVKKLNKSLKESEIIIDKQEELSVIGELARGAAQEINNPINFVGSNLENIGRCMSDLLEYKKLCYDFVEYIEKNHSDKADILEQLNILKSFREERDLEASMQEVPGLVQDSLEGTERIAKIIQSIRNFIKIGEGREKSYSDINGIVTGAIEVLKEEYESDVVIKEELQRIPLVLCNPVQIEQVVLSLVENGIHVLSKQESKGELTIKTYFDEKYVYCQVTDNGPGIPLEIRDTLFNPFFTTKEIGSSIGLGLNIAKNIVVTRHKGEIYFESELGKGTSFIFKLPLGEVGIDKPGEEYLIRR